MPHNDPKVLHHRARAKRNLQIAIGLLVLAMLLALVARYFQLLAVAEYILGGFASMIMFVGLPYFISSALKEHERSEKAYDRIIVERLKSPPTSPPQSTPE